MAEITLQAVRRGKIGDGPSKRLRAEGRVPATVYGLGKDPASVSVNWRELRSALVTDAGLTVVLNLDVEGDVDLAMIKALQRHPVRRDVMHVDFIRVDPDAVTTVDVPFTFEGEARAILSNNGIVDVVLTHLTVEAKPADIPDAIVIDISEMTIDTQIRVGDIELPAGVTTLVDPEELIVGGLAGDLPTIDDEGEGAEGETAEAAED